MAVSPPSSTNWTSTRTTTQLGSDGSPDRTDDSRRSRPTEDCLFAFLDADGNGEKGFGEPSGSAIHTFSDEGPPAAFDVSPHSQTAQTGTFATITPTVLADGEGVEGASVLFRAYDGDDTVVACRDDERDGCRFVMFQGQVLSQEDAIEAVEVVWEGSSSS